MNVPAIFFFLFSIFLLSEVETKLVYDRKFTNVEKRIQAELNSTIRQHFSTVRYSYSEKTPSYNYIKSTFFSLKLKVETVIYSLIGKNTTGRHIVGIREGSRHGTKKDNILIVAAHYDTVNGSLGVNDDGSGMAVMLQTAKQIYRSKCTLHNTIIFLALDNEEGGRTNTCIRTNGRASSKFVCQWLNPYLAKNKGTFAGVYMLETVMNYNNTENSQSYQPLQQSHFFDGLVNQIKSDQARGNFYLFITRKDEVQNGSLVSRLNKEWNLVSFLKTKKMNTLSLTLPFSGLPNATMNGLFSFVISRSDCYSFWNFKERNLKCLFLTDTANFRGYMQTCYHNPCDNLSQLTSVRLEFMERLTNSLVRVASSERNSICGKGAYLGINNFIILITLFSFLLM